MTRVTVTTSSGESLHLDLPQPAVAYRPVKVSTLDQLRAILPAPMADANLIMWTGGPRERSLNEASLALGPNDLLVLPEAAQSYLVDSSRGFLRYGDAAGPYGDAAGKVEVYDEMLRVKRGIVGMGPSTLIEVGPSAFTRPYQQKSAGGVSPKVIASSTPKSCFGNFEMRGRDLGTMAYNALGFNAAAVDSTYFDIFANGAHRGFRNSPGGEAGALTTLAARTTWKNFEIDCRDLTGKRVGASPLMTSCNMSGGHLIEDGYLHHAYAGMPVFYRVGPNGSHLPNGESAIVRRVRSEYNGSGSSGGQAPYAPTSGPNRVGWGLGGSQWNLELCAGTFLFEDFTAIANYLNNYKPGENPNPDFGAGNVGAHIGGGSDQGSCVINVVRPVTDWGSDGSSRSAGVRFDFQIQSTYNGVAQQMLTSDLHVADAKLVDGRAVTDFKVRG